MKYLLLLCADTMLEEMPAEEAEAHLRDMHEFTEHLRQTGRFVAANRLQPAGTASTVRVRDGRTLITDGPFAETTELIGGFYVIEVADRDEALAVAASVPTARFGSVELRAMATDPGTLALGFDETTG